MIPQVFPGCSFILQYDYISELFDSTFVCEKAKGKAGSDVKKKGCGQRFGIVRCG